MTLGWAHRCLKELLLGTLAGCGWCRRGLGRSPGLRDVSQQTEISGSCKRRLSRCRVQASELWICRAWQQSVLGISTGGFEEQQDKSAEDRQGHQQLPNG